MHHTRCLCIRVEHISGNVGISMRWRIIKLTRATPFSTTSSHARVASSMELSQTSHTHYSTKVSDNVQHASYTTCMKTIFRKSACAYACSRTLLLRSACITLRTRSTSVICKLQHALILHTQWGESLTEQEQGGPGLWPTQRKSEQCFLARVLVPTTHHNNIYAKVISKRQKSLTSSMLLLVVILHVHTHTRTIHAHVCHLSYTTLRTIVASSTTTTRCNLR